MFSDEKPIIAYCKQEQGTYTVPSLPSPDLFNLKSQQLNGGIVIFVKLFHFSRYNILVFE